MASSNAYLNYILEQLSDLDQITGRPMMGEFLLYYRGVLLGGIYDDRLLVKIVNSNKEFQMKEELPYPGAKSMYLVDRVDNKEILKSIILSTYAGLKKE